MQTKPIEVSEGKYIWQYKISLFKNPHIFILVAKVLFGTILGLGLVLFLPFSLYDNGFTLEALRVWGMEVGGMLAIFAVLLILGYLLYAVIMGGYYIVDFGMDETRLVHTQNAKQAKKADNISTAAVIMGLLAKNRGAVSAGMMSAGRTSSTTEFAQVKKVVVNKKRSVIKLWYFGWNEVYADGDDFDFVANWIRAHVPETAEWIVK